LSGEGIAGRRLEAQRLAGEPLRTAADVVRHLVAVQSQDYPGAKWALAQRMAMTTEAELDVAFDAGSFFRIHVLRPTWHFVAPEDLRWLTALTGPRVHQASAFQYRLLEIDDAPCAAGGGRLRAGPQRRPRDDPRRARRRAPRGRL
jgi:hypothetical protein